MEHVIMIIFDKTQPAVCNMYFSEKKKKKICIADTHKIDKLHLL